MALPEIDQVKDAALKYDKRALAKMVQMGQLSPTIATMAAMMRDRIVQSEMKEPETTVTEDVLPLNNTQMAGLAAVPTNPQMFQGMASGGIVAMANGGTPPSATFIGSLSGDRTIDPRVLRAQYLASGVSIRDLPDELKTPEERARYAQQQPVQQDFAALGQPENTATSGNIFKRIGDALMYSSDREAAERRAALAAMPDQSEAETQRLAAIPAPTSAGLPAAAGARPSVKPPAGLGATPEAAASPVTSVRDQAKAMAAEAVKIPAVPTVEEFIKRQSEMDERMGVDRKFEEKELAEIALQKANLKDERAQAANMRLLEAGLAIMGGASPYAFENIGKGASKALAGFTQDLKDIKKNETDLTTLERQIKRAENQYRKDKSDKNLAEIEKLRQRAEDKTQERTKMEMDLELKLRKLGLDKEQLAAYKQQVAQGGTSPLERIAANLRAENPKLTYADSIQKAYSMQQEPKTRAALEREFLERPDLVKKYGTYDNYVKSTGSGGVDYKSKYGLD